MPITSFTGSALPLLRGQSAASYRLPWPLRLAIIHGLKYRGGRRAMATTSTKPAKPTPAGEAWALMHELMMSMKGHFFAVAAEFELSPPQVMALRSLDPERPMPMSELASVMACDNSNVTGIVDRLEARGLVQRRASEHDRRVKMLAVTDAGAELRAQLLARMYAAPEALAALSAQDQRALRDLLRRALRP